MLFKLKQYVLTLELNSMNSYFLLEKQWLNFAPEPEIDQVFLDFNVHQNYLWYLLKIDFWKTWSSGSGVGIPDIQIINKSPSV